jgi:SSS family solute:Na+ symporter
MGKLLNLLVGWSFGTSILIAAGIVLFYTFMGGLGSAIYNEVLQFFLIVFGFAPLVFLGLRDVGGWSGLQDRLAWVANANGFADGAYTRSWAYMGNAASNPVGVEWFGLVMGLGFVLSFGYWCTDFLVVQRAMAADSMSAARRTPLIAAVPKMLMPFLVILPGMLALVVGQELPKPRNDVAATPAAAVATVSLASTVNADGRRLTADGSDGRRLTADVSQPQAIVEHTRGIIPPKIDPATGEPQRDSRGRLVLDYDLATPMMLVKFFPAGLLGLGLTALLASFMSGMAGNVTAFNTVWTYDIYQSYIRPGQSDGHYLRMGRIATVFGIAISLGAAYAAASFNNIMELLQLVFAFVNAPLFATFALGMFWKRATGHGAFTGLVSGTLAAAIHHGLTLPAGAHAGIKGGYFGVLQTFPSELAQTFWTAIAAFTTCFVVTIAVSLMTRARSDEEMKGLVYSLTPIQKDADEPWHRRPAALGAVVLVAALALNFLFW